MRSISCARGFTFLELLITVAIVGMLASIVIPNIISYRERRAAAPADRTVRAETQPQPESPYAAGGKLICQGIFDRVGRECADDQVCPTFVRFTDGRTCVVHDARPLNIAVPRGTPVRIKMRRVDTYWVESAEEPSLPAAKPEN